NEDRDGSIGLRGGLREQAIRDLALHHHAPQLEVRETIQALDDNGSRDVVGQVGNELTRVRRGRGEVELHGVAEQKLDVRPSREALAELRLKRTVQLDGVHTCHSVVEVGREHAQAGTDLEHDV